jgi:hypothetical protein
MIVEAKGVQERDVETICQGRPDSCRSPASHPTSPQIGTAGIRRSPERFWTNGTRLRAMPRLCAKHQPQHARLFEDL